MASRGAQIAGGAAGVSAAAVLAALALIKPWEGKQNDPYPDLVHRLTVCWGHTGPDVKLGETKTDAECEALLAADVRKHSAPIAKCLTRPVPDASMGAFISLAYNIGSGAFCRSSVARLANAGDLRGACDAMLKFNRAGGRFVQGLANRRAAEHAVCLRGLK